eukprot:gnl/MRDRNA2_/MRDRNA2_118636_c0_seq1.p1 gnl/MRDRNA2_/MRDRNA2_118636_c0~~gnl/MRDRNA2_/MRDRNA2_118636_c0_seq1.p1  ORF type:complete len:412 (+),score=90.98 gnl/MRDRNA2_/MRDRNA2_118636_c0_seq1:201-1436(+)
MGACGSKKKVPKVRTIPKEFGINGYDDQVEEKKEVPAIGGKPGEVSPEGAARLGWYNLKEDQFVVTKATAFPYGFDKYATTPRECKPKDGETPPTWADEKMNEFVVDAVIADENGKRYVNVLELVAVRKQGCMYVIRGRIERSSWRDKDDSWVNILFLEHEGMRGRQNVWNKTYDCHWSAEPVEAEVAQGSAGYQSQVAPQETPTTCPAKSFEEYRDAFMVKFQEACMEAVGDRKKKEQEQREYAASLRMTPTFTISLDGNVVCEIAKGKFNEEWSKNGDVLSDGAATWRIDFSTIIKDGPTPTGATRTHGWIIESHGIRKQKGKGYHVQECMNEEIELNGNEVKTHCGKTLIIEPKEWIDHLGQPKEAVPMDTKTLAFALVAMGMIDPNDDGNIEPVFGDDGLRTNHRET